MTRGGSCYIDFSGDIIKINAGQGNDTLVLRFHTNSEATINVGTGIDRVFCGDGVETISFHPGSAVRGEKSFLFVDGFAPGTDKIDLVSGMSVANFLSLGYDFNLPGTDGLRFDTTNGDTLFLAGFTAGQLTADDILV